MLCYLLFMPGRKESSKHELYPEYSVDTYLSYAKSIGLAIERRVTDNPPRRPASFWRICEEEIDVARWRMRNCSGQIRKLSSRKTVSYTHLTLPTNREV